MNIKENSIITDFSILRKGSNVLRAMMSPFPRAILLTLEYEGKMNVSQLSERLKRPHPHTSGALSRLRKAGLVELEERGTNHFYTINKEQIKKVGFLADLLCKLDEVDKIEIVANQ